MFQVLQDINSGQTKVVEVPQPLNSAGHSLITSSYSLISSGTEKMLVDFGKSGLLGGVGLGIAMISFIYSITNTSAAVTLLCLAAMPFFTALLAFL